MKNIIKTIPFLILLVSCLFTYPSASRFGDALIISTSGSINPARVVYFQSTFQYEGPDGYRLDQSWPEIEPCPYPNEKGIWHWVNCGPSLGTIRLVSDPADSGRICLQMLFDTAGTRPLSTNQQVKLYECQGREASNYVEPYPTTKEAYWHMKYWFPADFKVATNSWRLIWQFCGEENDYAKRQAPQFALIFGDEYLYLQFSQTDSFPLIRNTDLPKQRWVSIVVFVKQGSTFGTEDGTVVVWMDGVKLFEQHDLPTSTYSGTPYAVWGIGNYGGPYEAEGQFLYIKDVIVSNVFAS